MNNRGSKFWWQQNGAVASDNGHPSLLVSTARSLREACCETGLDQHGRRCPDCPVAGLCADESRWLVKRAGAAN